METLRISQVKKANREGIKPTIERGLDRLRAAQREYPALILESVKSDNLSRQIEKAIIEVQKKSRTALDNPLSTASGVYFFNEDIVSGLQEAEVLRYTNEIAEKAGLKTLEGKIKLGPGIGYIDPPSIYKELTAQGIDTPRLILNYNAPGGTLDTRRGIKTIVDTKIDPEGSFFPDDGVFLTESSTEAIDRFMTALSYTKPNSRIMFLGLSYYTGAFSAIQKGLIIDRRTSKKIVPNDKTSFFPTPEELSQSLPLDTSALVLTMPNNPNGEIYGNEKLKKIIQLAKEKDILILFDAIFENMYFDDQKNYQSPVLKAAYELGALDQIVIVDSLSKSKNYAGDRVGYIATTNRTFISELEDIVIAGKCNGRLPLEPLIQFEGLARKIKSLQLASPTTKLEIILDKVAGAAGVSKKIALLEMYTEWDEWGTEALEYYQENLEITKAIFEGSIDAGSPDKAAFNTLVRMANIPKNTNNVDYLAKLMFTLATYTQIGPCFGLSQKLWDEELGVWPRITYASSREDLIEGLVRLIVFNNFYAEKNFGDPNKFPVLNLSYDKQI